MKKLAKVSLILIIGLVLLMVVMPLLGACAKPAPAPKATAADFYKDKTVTLLCGYSAGGGMDLCARVVSTFLGDQLDARVVVKNMTGAGGLRMVNHTYKAAKPDGLTMAIMSRDVLWGNSALEAPGVEYDVGKFEYIGFMQPYTYPFMVKNDGPYKTIDDLKAKKGFRYGAQSPTGWVANGGRVAAEILGLEDAKVVTGYKGTGPMALAIAKGELDAGSASSFTAIRTEQQGQTTNLFLINMERDKVALPDLPALAELVKLTDSQKKILELYSIKIGRHFFCPPGTPKDRVKFLQDAFVAISKGTGLPRAMKKVEGYFTGYDTPDVMAQELSAFLKVKDEYKSVLLPLVKKYAP